MNKTQGWKLILTGPRDIMIQDKAGIQKMLVEEDFRKSRDYERVREDPGVTSLITETDKALYRQKVCKILLLFLVGMWFMCEMIWKGGFHVLPTSTCLGYMFTEQDFLSVSFP